jgi:hypothetical protein
MTFTCYDDCVAYAASHVWNPIYAGWHVEGGLVLNYHITGSFRLYQFGNLVREFKP